MPPIAGLHDICAIRSRFMVMISVLRPMRAAAMAASHPAWPAPTTATSNCSVKLIALLFYGNSGCKERRASAEPSRAEIPFALHLFNRQSGTAAAELRRVDSFQPILAPSIVAGLFLQYPARILRTETAFLPRQRP